MNRNRIKKLIEQSIATFSLNLSGSIILTEAASNYYMLTPLIAAEAGAKQVLALTRESRFGTVQEIQTNLMELAHQWNLAANISVTTDRTDDRIGRADIITNLGFVRPLDAKFLAQLKKTAAISLMWETWEYRPEDLDLSACRDFGIAVLGTNEHHPDLRIFEYIGSIALKLLLNQDIEIVGSKIAVLGNGEFADIIINRLQLSGSESMLFDCSKVDFLNHSTSRQFFKSADALIVAEHHHREQIIGLNGGIPPQKIAEVNPGICIVHICGNVDQKSLEKAQILHCPETFAPPGYMSVTTDFVDPKALIDLHTAGLKVGELMARCRRDGLSAFDSEMAVLNQTPLAQGFKDYHIMDYNND